VKPGEHPDFYRLPPPEGRSRESSIRLDRDGRFFHDGEPVVHPGMARAFASWIGTHPDDGRFILQNGYDWTYFSVEDTPYFVDSVRALESRLELELSDGTTELLERDGLSLDESGQLFASVKGGHFQARFKRAAQLAMGELLSEDEAGNWFLSTKKGKFSVALARYRPRATDATRHDP
jgi:nicotinamide riboside kinase